MKPPGQFAARKEPSLRAGGEAIQPCGPSGLPRRCAPRNDKRGNVAPPVDHAPAATDPALGDLRFRALMGVAQWSALAPAIRARFSKRLSQGRTALYAGTITETRMTRLGWLLAQAARVLGGPLPLSREAGVPATVAVTEDRSGGGQFWTRVYGRRRGFPQVIHSAKRFRGPTGLEEYLGRGLGMALTVDGAGDTLHFRSDHYFIEMPGLRLSLPRWLAPGDTTVSHIDHGGGRFTFVLELRHPRFGLLIRQTGLFHDVADHIDDPEMRSRTSPVSHPLPNPSPMIPPWSS